MDLATNTGAKMNIINPRSFNLPVEYISNPRDLVPYRNDMMGAVNPEAMNNNMAMDVANRSTVNPMYNLQGGIPSMMSYYMRPQTLMRYNGNPETAASFNSVGNMGSYMDENIANRAFDPAYDMTTKARENDMRRFRGAYSDIPYGYPVGTGLNSPYYYPYTYPNVGLPGYTYPYNNVANSNYNFYPGGAGNPGYVGYGNTGYGSHPGFPGARTNGIPYMGGAPVAGPITPPMTTIANAGGFNGFNGINGPYGAYTSPLAYAGSGGCASGRCGR